MQKENEKKTFLCSASLSRQLICFLEQIPKQKASQPQSFPELMENNYNFAKFEKFIRQKFFHLSNASGEFSIFHPEKFPFATEKSLISKTES